MEIHPKIHLIDLIVNSLSMHMLFFTSSETTLLRMSYISYLFLHLNLGISYCFHPFNNQRLEFSHYILSFSIICFVISVTKYLLLLPLHHIFVIHHKMSLNVSKTKELIVDFRKRQQRPYTPLMVSGTPVERVSSFKYLGVNISKDLTWTAHIQTQVKKARQRLYHLRQLRKFRVSPAILKTFYSGAIESVLTQCISVWYGNATNQDCKALQRVVRLAEHIGSALPSLQVIYLKRCKSRAVKIIKDSNHPGNHLFRLLPSGKRFRSMMAKTERLRRSFFPQAIRLLNTNSV